MESKIKPKRKRIKYIPKPIFIWQEKPKQNDKDTKAQS